MGDQKYLDSWPNDYSSCCIINNLGAGVAPWNYSQYTFSVNPSDSSILVDALPLIFYHFHQFQILGYNSASRLSSFYTEECNEPDLVYLAYEEEIFNIISELRAVDPTFRYGFANQNLKLRRFAQQHLPLWFKDFARSLLGKVS